VSGVLLPHEVKFRLVASRYYGHSSDINISIGSTDPYSIGHFWCLQSTSDMLLCTMGIDYNF
jgi:hypothetical protein